MEFHAWSLLGRHCLKKGCNRWNEAAESIKARDRSALQQLKMWGFSILLLPYPTVFGSWSRLHPRGACCSWQALCFGEVEEAPSDVIAKGCSGTVSLPGSSGAVCEQGSPTSKKRLSEFKIILLVINKNVLFAVC